MAERVSFQCNHCDQAVGAWSDGNPYYIDDQGKKVCAYHPDHEGLAKCTDNDIPYICLECGHKFNNDSIAHVPWEYWQGGKGPPTRR